MNLDKETQKHALGFMAALLLFFFIKFSTAGVLTFLILLILFTLPIYLILENFDFTLSEKIVFSVFLGLGIIPSLVYYPALWFGSIKNVTILVFIGLLALGYGLKKWRK